MATPTITPAAFVQKWAVRFADNEFQRIREADFREFAADIAAVFGVTVTNVPAYQAGTTYQVAFLVRYTPPGGQEAFYYALTAGKLSAPGPGNTTDWKVVPGPTTATALSQAMSLAQAQGLDGNGVVPGRLYLIDCGPDAQGSPQILNVRGVSNDKFDTEGTLEVNTQLTLVRAFDVQAGTWEVVGKEVWQFIGDASRFNVSLGPQYGCTYDSDQFANTYFTFHGQNSYGQTHGRNSYGVFHSGNTYGRNHQNNAYGASHRNNTYGEGHYQNQLAAYHAYNTYGDNHTNNRYGPNHNGNTYGSNHQNNTFGGNQNSNTYGDNCSELEVGPGCYGLQVGAGCQRVRIYNCHGGQTAFVIPAGTVDAEYRNNQLVKSGLSGYDYQPLYPSGPARPIQVSPPLASLKNRFKRYDTYGETVVNLPALTAADLPFRLVIDHANASGVNKLTVRGPGPFGVADLFTGNSGDTCEIVGITFGSQVVYAVESHSAVQQPAAGVFRGAYASSQRYLKNDLVVEPGGTLVYAKADLVGSPTAYDATQWTAAPGGGSGGGGTGVTATDLAVVATTLPLTTTRTGNYTLQAGDAGGVVPVAATATVTFPDNASVPLPVNSTGYVRRTGSDPVNVAPASGVQLLPPGVGLNLDTYGEVSWHKVDLNTYWLKGDLF